MIHNELYVKTSTLERKCAGVEKKTTKKTPQKQIKQQKKTSRGLLSEPTNLDYSTLR